MVSAMGAWEVEREGEGPGAAPAPMPGVRHGGRQLGEAPIPIATSMGCVRLRMSTAGAWERDGGRCFPSEPACRQRPRPAPDTPSSPFLRPLSSHSVDQLTDRRASGAGAGPPHDLEAGGGGKGGRGRATIDVVAAAAALPPASTPPSFLTRLRLELEGGRAAEGGVARARHTPLATPLLAAATVALFLFMAGAYPVHGATRDDADAACAAGEAAATPRLLWAWLSARGARWCYGAPAWTFDTAYLVSWGARLPGGVGGWRLPASWLLHVSAAHLLPNAALTLIVGIPLERAHNPLRVAAAWTAAAGAGGLASAAGERGCAAVVGSSGGLFGLLGMACVAAAVHRTRLARPVLTWAALAALAAALAAAAALAPAGVSHWSHAGGVAGGALASLFVLDGVRASRARRVAACVGAAGLAALLAGSGGAAAGRGVGSCGAGVAGS